MKFELRIMINATPQSGVAFVYVENNFKQLIEHTQSTHDRGGFVYVWKFYKTLVSC